MMVHRGSRWGWGKVISIAITLVWLGVMTHLVKNHLLPVAPTTEVVASDAELELTRSWTDIEEYMLLRLGNSTVGAFSTTVKMLGRNKEVGFRSDFKLGAQLKVGPLVRAIELKGAGLLDSELNLHRFHLEARVAGLPLSITGLAQGNVLMLRSSGGGEAKLARIALPHQVSLLEAIRPAALREFEIKTGNVLRMPVVDPLFSMQRGVAELVVKDKEKITIGGQESEAFRVESRLNDFVSVSWVDSTGRTLKRQLIGNLTMEVTTEDEAKKHAPVIAQIPAIPPIEAAEFQGIPMEDLGTALGTDSSFLRFLSGTTEDR